MSRLRRPIAHTRFLFVTTNLLRDQRPFTPHERDIVVASLSGLRKRLPFALCGYCLMPDHVHAIVFPHEESTISEVMRRFKLAVYQKLKAVGSRVEPFWQSRFYDHAVRTRGEFDDTLQYIHMNPVRRGLVENPLAWRWSSAPWLTDRTGPVGLDQIRLPSEAEARI